MTSSGRAKRTGLLLTRLTSSQGVRLSAQRPVRCRRRRRIEEKAKWVGKEAFSIKVVDVKSEGRDQGATPDGDRGVVVNRGVRETKESHPSPSFRRRKKGKKKRRKNRRNSKVQGAPQISSYCYMHTRSEKKVKGRLPDVKPERSFISPYLPLLSLIEATL